MYASPLTELAALAVIVFVGWKFFQATARGLGKAIGLHAEKPAEIASEPPPNRKRRNDDDDDDDVRRDVRDLRHEIKLLRTEWDDRESKMDSLVKRVVRHSKLPELTQPPEQPPAMPQSREAILANYHARRREEGV